MSDDAPDLLHKLHRGGQFRVWNDPTRFRVVVAGRKWGKTELDKAEIIREFGTPGLIQYIAPTYDMVRDLMWRPLRAAIPRAWLTKDPNETWLELETIWGCLFQCKSAEHPDRLRGRGPRKYICDEFQDWTNGIQTWEEVLLPNLIATDGAAVITGTPKSFNHLYKLWDYGQRGLAGWKSWQFRTADAPHIDKAFLAQMREQMDPRSYRQEFEASFEAMAGRAYYAFNRAQDVRPVELERAVPVLISHDFNVNPSCAVLCQRVRDELRVWREVVIKHAGGEATKATAQAAQRLLAEAGWLGDLRLYGDPSGRAQKTTGPSDHHMLSQVYDTAPGDGMDRWRIPTVAPHVRDRIAAVNGRCESMDGKRHLSVDPSCRELIADLEQVVLGDDGTEDQSDPMRTHCAAALGYLVAKEWPPRLVRQGMGSTSEFWI